MRVLTEYTIHTGRVSRPVAFAVVSDLHDEPFADILPMLDGADALLIPGDLTNRFTGRYGNGLNFVREASKRMPVYFEPGNHETRQKGQYPAILRAVEEAGAAVLENRFEPFGECLIGGWLPGGEGHGTFPMKAFEDWKGARILLCHRPEWYSAQLRDTACDLVLAGHAHGGQIRIRGQGLYAPGQGIFPKLTHGLWDGRLVISAGCGNPPRMPRWGNPEEVLRVTVD